MQGNGCFVQACCCFLLQVLSSEQVTYEIDIPKQSLGEVAE